MKKWIVILVVLAIGGYWGFTRLRAWKAAAQVVANGQRATTAVAGITNVNFAIVAAGDIGPADQVSVRPEINGKIKTLDVDIGDKVKRDSVLFTLDDKELQTEKLARLTEIEGARLQVAKSERNYLRSKQLYESKLISQELYEDSKTEFELAKNSLERAQRLLSQVEEKLTKTKILAPFDCTVLTRPVSMGQAVSGSGGFNSGTEVLTIANLNEMIITAHINQADVTRLKASQEVDIEVEAVPGLSMKGTIERVAPQATFRNGIKGFSTRILLTTIDPRVRPGMTANLSIPVASASNVVTVPLAAVFTEQGGRYVLVKKGDQYERRPVYIGVADYSLVEIQSGLSPGEIVALEQPPGMNTELDNMTPEKRIASLLPSGLAKSTNAPTATNQTGQTNSTTTGLTNRLPATAGK